MHKDTDVYHEFMVYMYMQSELKAQLYKQLPSSIVHTGRSSRYLSPQCFLVGVDKVYTVYCYKT